MLSRQALIRVRELDWGAPAVATPATPAAEEEALPGRGRPPRGRRRGRPPRPWTAPPRGRARGMSASQPEPERTSMLDEDGDINFDSVHLPLSQTSPHTLHFIGNIAAYSPLYRKYRRILSTLAEIFVTLVRSGNFRHCSAKIPHFSVNF